MIAVDIPMPTRCINCPMSYMIRTGDHAGETMCEGLEANGFSVSNCIVNEMRPARPANCPIICLLDDDGK